MATARTETARKVGRKKENTEDGNDKIERINFCYQKMSFQKWISSFPSHKFQTGNQGKYQQKCTVETQIL